MSEQVWAVTIFMQITIHSSSWMAGRNCSKSGMVFVRSADLERGSVNAGVITDNLPRLIETLDQFEGKNTYHRRTILERQSKWKKKNRTRSAPQLLSAVTETTVTSFLFASSGNTSIPEVSKIYCAKHGVSIKPMQRCGWRWTSFLNVWRNSTV